MITRLLIASVLTLLPAISQAAEPVSDSLTSTPGPPSPKARVVIIESPGATSAFKPRLEVLRRMVDRGVRNLTGKATSVEAWHALASTNATLGLKVVSSPGPFTGTRPEVAEAVVQSLLDAGWATNRLLIWDRQLVHLRLAGFGEIGDKYHIRVAASTDTGYDTNHYYDSAFLGTLVWGDREFGLKGPGIGRKSYVSKLVTQEMTNIISIAPLLNHNLGGVNGHLVSLSMGSVDNTVRFTSSPSQFAIAVPDIFALPSLGDRVVLNITDALLGQYSGEETVLLHYSGVLDQLRFSKDPVALDVLSVRELERLRELDEAPRVKTDMTLYENASLVEIGVSDPRNIQVEIAR